VNSDNAGTSPLSITNGTVLEVDDGSSGVMKVDDDTFRGDQIIFVDIRVPDQTPS